MSKEILLKRNFISKDQEQEKAFQEIENISLFLKTEKFINGIDTWNIGNLNKLINSIQKEKNIKINLYFSNWNKNIEKLYLSLFPKVFDNLSLPSEDFMLHFKNKQILQLRNLLKMYDVKQKIEILFWLQEKTENNKELLKMLNYAINTNLVNLNHLIELLIIKLLGDINA